FSWVVPREAAVPKVTEHCDPNLSYPDRDVQVAVLIERVDCLLHVIEPRRHRDQGSISMLFYQFLSEPQFSSVGAEEREPTDGERENESAEADVPGYCHQQQLPSTERRGTTLTVRSVRETCRVAELLRQWRLARTMPTMNRNLRASNY